MSILVGLCQWRGAVLTSHTPLCNTWLTSNIWSVHGIISAHRQGCWTKDGSCAWCFGIVVIKDGAWSEERICGQLVQFVLLTGMHQFDTIVFPQISHSFAKYAFVHQIKEVMLEITFGLLAVLHIFSNVGLHPIFYLNHKTLWIFSTCISRAAGFGSADWTRSSYVDL